MTSKILKSTMRSVVLFMIILTMSMYVGMVTVNAEPETNVSKTKDYQYVTYVDASDDAVYSLKASRTYGVAKSIADTDTRIDLEGFYGVRLEIKNNQVWYSAYKHSKSVSEKAVVTLYKMIDGELVTVRQLGSVPVDTNKKLTVGLNDDFIYVMGAKFVIDGIDEEQESYGYLYRHGGKISTCRVTSNASGMNRQITGWTELLEGADPEDYLSNEKITYPTSGSGNSVTHVKQWEDISDDLVLHDDWTDEMRVFAFVNYLSKNVAYDDYRYRQANHQSRAGLANDYTKDKYFTLENNVGVCWDYTNILTIMCRHHRIPCTSVENDHHTINAVWLGGEWLGIDITDTAEYRCDTEDTDRENWIKNGMATYAYYGSYGEWSTFDTVNESIWTREKGLGLK